MTEPRRLSMSRTGRWAAIRHAGEIELVDLLGASPNRPMRELAGDFSFVGAELWGLERNRLFRVNPVELKQVAPALPLPGTPREILAGFGHTAVDAVVIGEPSCRVSVRGEMVGVEPLAELGPGDEVIAVHGQRIFIAGPTGVRAFDRGGRELWRSAPLGGVVLGAWVMFGGRALAILVRDDAVDSFRVLRTTGAAVHQLAVPRAEKWALAEEIGHGFVCSADQVVMRFDLRYGKQLDEATAPIPLEALAVDQDGRHMLVVGPPGEGGEAQAVHLVIGDLFRARAREAAEAAAADEPAPDDAPAPARPAAPAPEPAPHVTSVTRGHGPSNGKGHAPATDAAEGDAPATDAQARPRVIVSDALPLALGPPPPPAPPGEASQSPYLTARAHLDAMLDLVAARVALAIADAWNSGRLSSRDATRRPHELEVAALVGTGGGYAPDKLAETTAQVETRQREASARAQASAARGIRLPFPELAREVGLSAVAAQVLLLVAAPAIRGEIARLYGVLSNDPNRPLVDRFLVEQIVGEKSSLRDQIARELAPDSPLVRHGIVHVGASAASSLFAPLAVPDSLLDRLRGLPVARTDDVAQVRAADRALAELHMPDELKRDLVDALAEPRPPHDALRLVLRGRRGSGRHTMIAAVAARVQREVIAIDTARMPRAPRELVAALRSTLFRASVHGLVPVLSGLELIEPTDNDLRELVRQVLRTHPGPLVVRTSPESQLPIDPGFVSLTVPPLSETARAAAWSEMCARAGIVADVDQLAARYRIGPGQVARVINSILLRGQVPPDATALLDEQVRQHVATRLEHVANRVHRLTAWEDVALPEEMLDSLREFIGRARHRRTVYERWGYDAKMTTSRGLTALFYGPPGTGKTMVAGVIASELGLDLYRVDLARVVSKWVGETEKNLAEVFDAAEDGQVLILFDEADSLFAKRTDVKTSNDRYANLEVNYLLQRLDTFEGVAVLTSNLDSAIDPAFRRRLSLRLQFPFPDEEMRVRLWAAHVTPQTPSLGDFDFVELARRYPLSGGYIRNCAVRAAFLAAHEGRPMSQEHLVRAITLEYRELGKLSTTSRIE
jgi:hypothetical protein